MRVHILLSLVLLTAMVFPSAVFAQCSDNQLGNPGQEGEVEYFSDNVLKYCDGTSWIPMVAEGQSFSDGVYGGSYVANAVHFDGTNDYLTRDTVLTGTSDSNKWTGSFWYRAESSGAVELIDSDQGAEGDISILTHAANGGGAERDLNISAENVSGVRVFNVWIHDTALDDGDWHHVMFSFDLSDDARRHVFIDGAEVPEGSGSYEANFTVYNNAGIIDFTPIGAVGYSVGASTNGVQKLDGQLADFWMNFGTYIDLSVEDNRNKFLDYGGAPKYLGINGELVTGSAPDIFFSGNTTNWHINRGSGGGGFTENGTLTDNPDGAPVLDVLTDMVAHWKMDETSGNVPDDTGNGHTATANGNWIYNTTGGVHDGYMEVTAPVEGETILDAGSSSDFDLPNGSVSLWVKFPSMDATGSKYLFAKDDVGNNQGDFAIIVDDQLSPDHIGFKTNDGSGDDFLHASTEGIADDEWFHVVAVFGSGGAKFYINGLLKIFNPDAEDGMTSAAADIIIGNVRYNEALSMLVGEAIDDVRVYNRRLSDGEVDRIYAAGSGTYYNVEDKGFFVLAGNGPSSSEANEFDGDFGGLNGANTQCLSYLQTYDWNGKTEAQAKGLLKDGNVFAWLCDSGGCQDMQPERAYQFATTQDGMTGYGGAIFFSTNQGYYPADADNGDIWDNQSQFNRYTFMHTGRANDNTPHANNCSDWTDGSGGSSSRRGDSSANDFQRFSDTNTNCNTRDQIICVVNPPPGPDTGKIGHWRLDETSGTTARDSSGYGNHGTMEDGLDASNDSKSGILSNAMDFDGTDDVINVGELTDFSTVDFTILAWIKADTVNGADQNTIFSQWGTPRQVRFDINGVDSGELEYTWHDGSAYRGRDSNTIITPGVWTHVALVVDQTNNVIRFYENGENDGSNPAMVYSIEPGIGDAHIGRRASVQQAFDGLIDDLRVYNRVLSDAEIRNIYQVYSRSSLVGHWRLDEESGTTAYDSSGYGNDGTMQNDLDALNDSITGKVGTALNFDGTNDRVYRATTTGLSPVGEVTVAAWINSSLFGQEAKIASRQSGQNGFKLSLHSNNKVELEIRDGSGPTLNRSIGGGTIIEANQWYHVAGVYSDEGDYIATYVNGVLDRELTTAAVMSPNTGDTAFAIGSESYNTSNPFNGNIDDIRLYSRALDAGEISALASCTKPGQQYYNAGGNVMQWCNGSDVFNMGNTNGTALPAGLVGYWQFEDGAGSSNAVDSSGTGNTGTLTSMDTSAAWVTGYRGGGLEFNSADTNDAVVVSDHASIRNLTTMTACAWVYPTLFGTSQFPSVFDKSSASADDSWNFYINDQGGEAISLYDRQGIYREHGNVPINNWTHICSTTDFSNTTGGVNIYKNGQLETSGGGAGDAGGLGDDVGHALFIGRASSGAHWFRGILDELMLFNRELSPSEIEEIYNGVYSGGGGICSQAGAMNYNTDRYQFCNGSNWVDIGK